MGRKRGGKSGQNGNQSGRNGGSNRGNSNHNNQNSNKGGRNSNPNNRGGREGRGNSWNNNSNNNLNNNLNNNPKNNPNNNPNNNRNNNRNHPNHPQSGKGKNKNTNGNQNNNNRNNNNNNGNQSTKRWNQKHPLNQQSSAQHPSQTSGRPFTTALRESEWWSVPYEDYSYQTLIGSFDKFKDPAQNPFTLTNHDTRSIRRHPLEVDLENIIGWSDVVHEYTTRDNSAVEYCHSTCIALAQQLLIAQTGLQGAPEFFYDLDMKSPGLIEPETMNKFLDQVVEAVRAKNGRGLRDILQIEPPFANPYDVLIQDLRRRYPYGDDKRLEEVCENSMKDFLNEIDSTWGAFPMFLRDYFKFIRDVDISNLVVTHSRLMQLLKQCIVALGDSTMGLVVLPTVLRYSKLLTKLTIGLDKQPELIASMRRQTVGDQERPSLVEDSANVIREAFSKCLNDRTGAGMGRTSKPEGKRIGIYATANMCLKLFIQCKKLENAQQMFTSISQQSPPLSLYPKAQRVTFLYYLGRYMFANSHFYRAVQTLEEAYSQCHSTMLRHRRLIVIHLIASNMILGRNPSSHLFNRSEAQGLQQIFGPIITAISKGNIQSFRSITSLDGDSPIAEWLLQKRLLLQIRNRCEILVWRSLARKIFLIDGFHGDGSNKMPTFSLKAFQQAATFLENKAAAEPLSTISGNAAREPNGLSNGLPKSPNPPIPKFHALYPGYIAMELDGIKHNDQERYTPAPQLIEIESVFSSLMHQKLMNGQLVRGENPRFGIGGAKGTVKGALKIGWPSVWETLRAKAEEDGSGVPGWVLAPGEEATPTPGRSGGGGPGSVGYPSGVGPTAVNPFGGGGLSGGNPFSGGNLAGENPFVR